MSDKPLPRPRHVTFSGWTIVVGSVMTVLYAYQRIAELGSLEAQEAAAEFVSTAPGDSLGLGVDDVQTAIRIMCLVAGGIAAATAILGWQVLQRSRSARVVLSVLAPVLFVAGLTSGGIFSALVAAGVVMLWAQPARDWFNGKAPAREVGRPAATPAMAGRTPYPPPGAGDEPSAAPQPSQPSHPYGAPYAPPPPPGAATAAVRPGRVTAAAVITLVASGLTLAGLLASLVFITSQRADFVREVEGELATNAAYDGLSAQTVADVAVGFLVVLLVWCVVAMVLAVATLRGSGVARIALVVSAALSALVSLLGVLVVVPLLLTVASIATVVLLLSGDSGAWFAARRRPG